MRGTRSICMLGLAVIVAAAAPAAAAPKKKYHFELTAVSAKPEVKPEVARMATPRVDAQVR